jgi:hypothetical protein
MLAMSTVRILKLTHNPYCHVLLLKLRKRHGSLTGSSLYLTFTRFPVILFLFQDTIKGMFLHWVIMSLQLPFLKVCLSLCSWPWHFLKSIRKESYRLCSNLDLPEVFLNIKTGVIGLGKEYHRISHNIIIGDATLHQWGWEN